MKKVLLDLQVRENVCIYKDEAHNPLYFLLKLTAAEALPETQPGQFVSLRVDNSPATFLRRPVSIHWVDRAANELWLLVRVVGEGTRRMAAYAAGDVVNVLLPLGKGFSLPESAGSKALLIGGGVGIAPLLYMGKALVDAGCTPVFLLGARSRKDLLTITISPSADVNFRALGEVHLATEDGSAGEKGLVTQHSILRDERFARIYTCGPKPMMQAVARYAASHGIDCEASLENTMACGIGACLCCVEKKKDGHHVCVCTAGPVFNSKELGW